MEFEFIASEIIFSLDTGKNETTYPALQKLKNKQIKFVTTGIWTGQSEKVRICEHNLQFMRLGLLDIGESFQLANEVQFIPGVSESEPSIVILSYDDYDHIFRAEADEAYNELLNKVKARPLLEITSMNSESVNLKVWDILIDLDVRIEGLKYSPDQLKSFLSKTGERDSFAFALGFLPTGSARAAVASTKSEGFELITLKGYTYKKFD